MALDKLRSSFKNLNEAKKEEKKKKTVGKYELIKTIGSGNFAK
mgnify:CR=1 FL=1